MPVAVIAILKELWALRYLVLCIGLVGVFWWYSAHERNIGAEKCEAAVKAATEAEKSREDQINRDWGQWADGANQNADRDHRRINALQKQYATASAANNARQCFNADAAQRVRSISGRGAADPGPAPSGPQR